MGNSVSFFKKCKKINICNNIDDIDQNNVTTNVADVENNCVPETEYIYCPICSITSGSNIINNNCKFCNEELITKKNNYCYKCSIMLKVCFCCGKQVTQGNYYINVLNNYYTERKQKLAWKAHQNKAEYNKICKRIDLEQHEKEKKFKDKTSVQMVEILTYRF